jgi:hypothetical protein
MATRDQVIFKHAGGASKAAQQKAVELYETTLGPTFATLYSVKLLGSHGQFFDQPLAMMRFDGEDYYAIKDIGGYRLYLDPVATLEEYGEEAETFCQFYDKYITTTLPVDSVCDGIVKGDHLYKVIAMHTAIPGGAIAALEDEAGRLWKLVHGNDIYPCLCDDQYEDDDIVLVASPTGWKYPDDQHTDLSLSSLH